MATEYTDQEQFTEDAEQDQNIYSDAQPPAEISEKEQLEQQTNEAVAGAEEEHARREDSQNEEQSKQGDDLREAVAKLIELQQQQYVPKSEEAAAPQVTPEQLEEILKPVRVNAQMLEAMGFEDPSEEQIKAMQSLVNGITEHSTRLNNYIVQRRLQEINQQIQPIQSHMQMQAAQQAETRFYTEYKDLSEYKDIVQQVATNLSQTRPDLAQKDEKTVFNEVAKVTRDLLKRFNVQPPQSSATSPARNVPKPERTSSAGRSVSNYQPNASTNFNPDADIYREE